MGCRAAGSSRRDAASAPAGGRRSRRADRDWRPSRVTASASSTSGMSLSLGDGAQQFQRLVVRPHPRPHDGGLRSGEEVRLQVVAVHVERFGERRLQDLAVGAGRHQRRHPRPRPQRAQPRQHRTPPPSPAAPRRWRPSPSSPCARSAGRAAGRRAPTPRVASRAEARVLRQRRKADLHRDDPPGELAAGKEQQPPLRRAEGDRHVRADRLTRRGAGRQVHAGGPVQRHDRASRRRSSRRWRPRRRRVGAPDAPVPSSPSTITAAPGKRRPRAPHPPSSISHPCSSAASGGARAHRAPRPPRAPTPAACARRPARRRRCCRSPSPPPRVPLGYSRCDHRRRRAPGRLHQHPLGNAVARRSPARPTRASRRAVSTGTRAAAKNGGSDGSRIGHGAGEGG